MVVQQRLRISWRLEAFSTSNKLPKSSATSGKSRRVIGWQVDIFLDISRMIG
jgi:hypothetical protein